MDIAEGYNVSLDTASAQKPENKKVITALGNGQNTFSSISKLTTPLPHFADEDSGSYCFSRAAGAIFSGAASSFALVSIRFADFISTIFVNS